MLLGHSTGGLVLSLWADRHPGVASAVVLNSPWLEFQLNAATRAAIAPVLGIQFDLSADALIVLTGAILLGTPALSGIGAIGAALTLGLRGGGVLLSLLVLPLYIPVLIFGAGAVEAVVTGTTAQAHLSLLGALTLGSVFFAPWPTAAALRIALE